MTKAAQHGLDACPVYFKSWQPVELEKIQKILEAARLQCQHGNAQLTRKAVVVERGKTPMMFEINTGQILVFG